MLGVVQKHKPITGKFVDIVRDALRRAISGNLNTKERECEQREKEVSQLYKVVWK